MWRWDFENEKLNMKKETNKLWISSLLAVTLELSVANGEMIQTERGIVIDTDTKLMWQDNLEAKTVKKDWQGAIDYCENLKLGGFDDWKLPDKDTLNALYQKKNSLRNVHPSYYWSSSTWAYSGYHASGIYFEDGFNNVYSKRDSTFVRCVRDSNFDTLTFSTFLEQLKTSHSTQNSILLSSSFFASDIRKFLDKQGYDTAAMDKANVLESDFVQLAVDEGYYNGITKNKLSSDSSDNEFKLFLIKKDGKNYFGTKNELLIKLSEYSKTPFETIQKLTQEKLNDYLIIPTISQPTLPKPLNLVKDEFESKVEFKERIAKETAKRESEIQKLQDEFRGKVDARNLEHENRKANIVAKKKEYLFDNFTLVMGNPILSNPIFDAETNTMFVDVAMSNAQWKKKVAIKMEDRNLAKNFKNNIYNTITRITFGYENDGFVLQNIELEFEDKNLVATLDKSDFKPEKVAVTIENKKVAFNELQNPNLVDKYQVSALGYGESNTAKGLKYNNDLTPMIKNLKSEKVDSKKWLFVVAVENYDEADAVTYAKNSAEDFVKVAQKRLGISERNTYALIDDKATSGSIKDRLDMMLKNVKDGDSVYFYYSGHGIPNPNDGEAYILPKDKIVDYVVREKEFMVRNIYKQLSDSKASKVIAFMDSCFSGNTDGISNIKGVAATRVKTKKVEFDKDKMVVLTAGTANQFSNMYKEKGHRLFSYFLTKAMIERPNLDVDSIYKSIAVDVKDESFKMGDLKVQEPQMEGNNKIEL